MSAADRDPRLEARLRPAYYKIGELEVIDVVRSWGREAFVGFCLGNILKYITRCQQSGDLSGDLAQAGQYIEFLLKYAGEVPEPGPASAPATERVLLDAAAERRRQAELKARGKFARTPADLEMSDGEFVAVEEEEKAEYREALAAGDNAHAREEALQCAAVWVARVEYHDALAAMNGDPQARKPITHDGSIAT
jgi:hypothetical protein